MFTRQNLLDLVKANIPQAYQAAGIGPTKINYWDQWILDGLSTSRNRWLDQLNREGKWTQLLANTILLNYNLSSIGYNQPDKRQVNGDQLRAYLAIAQAVFDQSVANITSLQIQISQAAEPKATQLRAELQRQESSSKAAASNLKTQKDTLDNAIKAGQAI